MNQEEIDLLDDLFGIKIKPLAERHVKRDTVNIFTIDTVETLKPGMYETAIWLSDNVLDMSAVETYGSREDAESGHKRWVDACSEDPNGVLNYIRLQKRNFR